MTLAREQEQRQGRRAVNETIKTTIHSYHYDTSKPYEAQAYTALVERLKHGPSLMKSYGGGSHYQPGLDGRTVELETEHLFSNQWNTAPIPGISDKGLRVFDWAEDALFGSYGRENLTLRQGHYLTQTQEMRDIRARVTKCGYCGGYGTVLVERVTGKPAIHTACFESEYLKESELHLCRMLPVRDEDKWHTREPLTEEERAELLPLYREAQLHGTTELGKAQLAKQRADIEARFTSATVTARVERDGLLWLLDHGLKIENAIYYPHTRKFCFGWRTPLSAEVKSSLLDALCEFPFAYELKAADGTKVGPTSRVANPAK